MSQTALLLDVLKDNKPHNSYELIKLVYQMNGPSSARLAARIHDLKKRGLEIDSWQDKDNKKLHWYQMRQEEKATVFHK